MINIPVFRCSYCCSRSTRFLSLLFSRKSIFYRPFSESMLVVVCYRWVLSFVFDNPNVAILTFSRIHDNLLSRVEIKAYWKRTRWRYDDDDSGAQRCWTRGRRIRNPSNKWTKRWRNRCPYKWFACGTRNNLKVIENKIAKEWGTQFSVSQKWNTWILLFILLIWERGPSCYCTLHKTFIEILVRLLSLSLVVFV